MLVRPPPERTSYFQALQVILALIVSSAARAQQGFCKAGPKVQQTGRRLANGCEELLSQQVFEMSAQNSSHLELAVDGAAQHCLSYGQ